MAYLHDAETGVTIQVPNYGAVAPPPPPSSFAPAPHRMRSSSDRPVYHAADIYDRRRKKVVMLMLAIVSLSLVWNHLSKHKGEGPAHQTEIRNNLDQHG